jgi:mannose-1-phosphate guanylyltransferase
MFVWSVPSIMAEMARQAPELEEFVLRLCKVGDVPGYIAEAFPGMPKISVDYAIMEKAPRVLVMEAGFDWDDVGGWVAVSKYLPACDGGNASNVPLLAQEATDNIVFSSERKLVALAGVRDLIVIETADALLVCHRSEAEKIKNLVPRLPEELK